MTTITHAVAFADEAGAKAALPQFWMDDGEGGWTWRRDIVDGPFQTYHHTGTFVTDPDTGEQSDLAPDTTYNLNIALPALQADLPGLVGAWEQAGTLLFGTHPVTPQRVFAR